MSNIGDDCPECGKRLSVFGDCRCGWKPQAMRPDEPVVKGCRECARIRHAYGMKPDDVVVCHCDRCGAHSRDTDTFDLENADTIDRGIRLCPACKIPALKRRMERDRKHGDVCECGTPVKTHRAEFLEFGKRWEQRQAPFPRAPIREPIAEIPL